MVEQRIEQKRRELADAQVILRAARKVLLDAEVQDCVSGARLVALQKELTRAEEAARALSAELEALCRA